MVSGSPSYRKRLFALHGWLGLNVGLWLCVVCLTGAIASLTYEIEWVTDPALRIQPQGPIQWQQTYETLTRAYPGAEISVLSAHETAVLDSLAWQSYITYPDGRWGQARVDPYHATIVRPARQLYLTHFIRQLHYNAHSDIGFYIIGFLALPLFLAAVSGMLFYKNWWRSFFKLRTGHGPRVFWSSAHPFIGVWSLIFAIIIAVTGMWYLTEDFLAEDLVIPERPTLSAEQLAAHGPTPKKLPLEQYISAARKAFPDLEPTGVEWPYSSNETVSVWGRTGAWLIRDRANVVYLDPFSGDVIAVEKARDSGLLTWWANSVDSLHFGYWGGLAGKALWCFFGLSLPALMLSGAYLSFRRSGLIGGKRTGKNADRSPIWKRFPMRSIISVGLLCAIVWTTTISWQAKQNVVPPPFVTLGSASIGPWTASLSREPEMHLGETTNYYLRIEAGEDRVPNFKQARVRLADSRTPSEPVMASGQVQAMRAAVPTPEHLSEEVHMVLEIETWDGNRYLTEFVDAWHDTQRHDRSGGHASPEQPRIHETPQLSATLVAVLAFFWIVTVTVGTVWLWIDRRIEA
ncbi:MAG: hypothetical protein NPIRA03_28150 [Nitrospirales bacterium]|nr:MAG: hypothetical protein NPIRA03_28150 [Nitrospirales bacterium]